MSDYIIAIPSYRRSNKLQSKTLTCLRNAGIDKSNIYVFVVQEEYDQYLADLEPSYYHEIIPGALGLVQQREFIQSYFKEGTKIVSLDDDIESVDLSLTDYKTLDQFFKDAFTQCEIRGAYIWSVYPVLNPFFRKERSDVTEELAFCIGAFYGFINRYDDDLTLQLTREGNKEDVERSLLYWLKDGKTLRFNRIGFKTKYYSTGGLGGLKERLDDMKKYSILINEKYPEYTKIKIRKNGLYEIVFKKQKQQTILQPLKEDDDVYFLKPVSIDNELLQEIYAMLEDITIPMNSNKTGRAKTFGRHRAMTLGFIKGRVSRKYGLSACTKRFPELYEAIKTFGNKICPFDFTAIHINKNVVCPRHLDPKNTGKSVLISIGDYEGGELVIENKGTYNTFLHPLVFDGTKYFHYNTPITAGTKYSFVFFTNDK